ncbi:MAG: glycosyltransferase [Chloroflexi bacterium]|nr:glycosyltransferase [Chloroflexota bacterium]
MEGIFHKVQAEAMVRLGTKIKVVAPIPWVPPLMERFSEKWRTYHLTPPRYSTNSVEIFRPRYPAFPRQSYWGIPHLPMYWATRACGLEKPDLIHAHFSYPQGLLASLLARYWNVPWLLTLHGDDVNIFPQTNRLSLRRFTAAVCGSGLVTAVSADLAKRAAGLTAREPKVLPIGVDLALFHPRVSRKDARARLGLHKDMFLVLFVGSLVPAKGIRELLAALDLFDPGKAGGVFVGDGPLAPLVRSSSRASAFGPKPLEDIPLFLAASDVLALPSHQEGLGQVIVEAGAAGLPVIGSAVGGIPELLSEGRGYLVPPRSVKALAEAISGVKENYAEARERGMRLQAYVRKYHDVNANSQELRSWYLRLLEDKRLP